MKHFDIKQIISEVKATHSVFNFLKYQLGIPVPHIGAAINTPDFIRNDDTHPSFGVYDNLAVDFAHNKFYDVIDLCALSMFNNDFKAALEFLYGREIWTDTQNTQDIPQHNDYSAFEEKIIFWHKELFSHQEILDYCHSRHLSDEFLKAYKIGYSTKRQRLIFPYAKNNHFVYWNGRDMSGNSSLDKDNPAYVSKYQKCPLASSPICENVAWGLQSLRPHSKTKHSYLADDGNYYDTNENDPKDTTLCIIEGMVDAASFIQEGWQVISPGGGNFNSSYMPTVLDICRVYDRVFVCFDNDEAGKNFQNSMSRTLFNARINFICGHIPTVFNGKRIKDVNDYYCAGGDLADLVKNATLGIVELARNSHNVRELADIFTKAARCYPSVDLYTLKEECKKIEDTEVNEATGFHMPKYSSKFVNFLFSEAMKPIPESVVVNMVAQKHRLIYDVSGEFYEYASGIWSKISEVIVQKYVGEALGDKSTSIRMSAISKHIKAKNAGNYAFNTKPVICFPNGTLHLDTMPGGCEPAFRRHNEADMSTIRLPYMYNAEATAPKWQKFMHDICDGNPEKMLLMQQMAGYIMYPDNRLHKMFYLIGDGRNGKSVFANILTQIYGAENCSSVSPSRLGSQFDPIALKDSLLNICYEAKSILNGSEETLKAVTSGDPIMAAHKGVDAVSFKTRAKLMVLSNKLWSSDDVSYGFLSRIIFLRFDRQFLGNDDNKNLYSELLKELPGIFNWCYEGYLSLKKSGEFQVIDDQAKVCAELAEMMSPVHVFTNEVLLNADRLETWSGRMIEDREIYRLYKEWCMEGGFKIENRLEFLKDMALLLRQKRTGIRIASDEYAKCKVFVFPSVQENAKMGESREESRPARSESRVIAVPAGSPTDAQEAAPNAPEGKTSESNDETAISESARENVDSPLGTESNDLDIDGDTASETDVQRRNENSAPAGIKKHSAHPINIGQSDRGCLLNDRCDDNNSPAVGSKSPAGNHPQRQAINVAELREKYKEGCRLRSALTETDIFSQFTFAEWDAMREEYKAGTIRYPGDFMDDFHFYGRNAYRNERLSDGRHMGYVLNDYETQKMTPDMFLTLKPEQIYQLTRQYKLDKFNPQMPEDWDMLATFFMTYPDLEPPYFSAQYSRAMERYKSERRYGAGK